MQDLRKHEGKCSWEQCSCCYMFDVWFGPVFFFFFFPRGETERWAEIQHWRWPFIGARWHHVHECAFALGPIWLPLSKGIFSLTPMLVILSRAWAELLAHSARVHRRQSRDIGIQMNLKYHHPLLEERAFSQDLGFRWDTAVFPNGWCDIRGQVKGTEQHVAQWSPHLPWWLVLQVAPLWPEFPHRDPMQGPRENPQPSYGLGPCFVGGGRERWRPCSLAALQRSTESGKNTH